MSRPQQMGAGFRKDCPQLRSAFNTFLARCRQDGTYARLLEKYFPTASGFFPEFFKDVRPASADGLTQTETTGDGR